MIRRAVLLAGGLGTRLRPLTESTPKCLLPLGGKPLLAWWLDALAAQGVEEAVVNGHHLHEQVSAFLASRRAPPRTRFFHEPRLLGSGGTIAAQRDFLQSEPAFWIGYADTWIGSEIGALAEAWEGARPALVLGLFRAPRPSECGVVEIDGEGRVLSFIEKPAAPRSDLAFAGVAIATPRLLARLPAPSAGAPVDLGREVLPRLVEDGARGVILERVIDIGTPESYARAQRELS